MSSYFENLNEKLSNLDHGIVEKLGKMGREKRLQVVKGKDSSYTDSNLTPVQETASDGSDTRRPINRKSPTEMLMELVNEFEVIHDGSQCFCIVPANESRRILNLDDGDISDVLFQKFYRANGKPPSDIAVKTTIKTLKGIAKMEGKEYKLSYRLTNIDGDIWYDLVNDAWQAIRISKEGWEIVNVPPIIFKRNTTQSSQVIPMKGGDLDRIFKYVNVGEEYKLLFKAYLITCLIPNIPHPIAVFKGEKGGAKTTAARVIKKLVDPSGAEIASVKGSKDMILTFSFNHLICFDNLSAISAKFSDELCKAVTGSNDQQRLLYTNDKTLVSSFKNCIVLTCIDDIVERDDLLDRCLMFSIDRISPEMRKLESEFWPEFEKDRPYILGEILDVLAKALKIYPSINLKELSRMADFNKWAYVVCEAMSAGLGNTFLDQYKANMDRHNLETLLHNTLAVAIMAFLERQPGKKWEGSASALLCLLREIAYEKIIDTKDHTFPKSSVHVTRKLNRIKSNLEQAGIKYSHGYTKRNESCITLSIVPINTVIPDKPIQRFPITEQTLIKKSNEHRIDYTKGEL